MFKSLDPLLHSELRLAIMSLLLASTDAEFGQIREQTGATAGNVSVQLQKLEEAGYISIKKSFKGKYPLTTCRITKKGINSFEAYVDALKDYLKPPG